MNGEILILFVILLLALVLCSFLGGSNCSNTNKEGFTSANVNGTYKGPNGANAVVTDNNIVFTNNGNVITLTKNTSDTTYTNVNGYTATFNSNGELVITDSKGQTVTTSTCSSANGSSANGSSTTGSSTTGSGSSTNYDNYNHYDGSSYPTIYYGPNGSTARVINVDGQGKIVITNANGTTNIYYVDTSASSSATVKIYKGPNGGTAVIATDSNGKQMVSITMPNGSKVIYYSDNIYASTSQDPTINQSSTSTTNGSSSNGSSSLTGSSGSSSSSTTGSSAYYSSLPTGIPASQIVPGEEDLYILKSQVVPPVCPKCPDPIMQSSEKFDASKCPACPPCARCPEPAFDCKKVPNYNAFNPNYMPVPVLSDFSSFGM